MNLDNFVINKSASIREALERIDSNHHGMIFVIDDRQAVIGLATDGDIRRYLVNRGGLDDSILASSNSSFLSEKHSSPRELLLKKLDNKIRVIPLLDESNRLVDLVSHNHIPVQQEYAVYARARAPVRISFGGGGSDLTHYFSDAGSGAVVNATVSLYSHATLRLRNDDQIFIKSTDLNQELQASNLQTALTNKGEFGLIQALLKSINPNFGFELYLNSDFPIGSGLGGSAVISAAILGCFNQFRRDQWDSYELAEIAYQAERLYLGVAGGWQDQYATVFGGLNFMEFCMDQNVVHPLRIHPDILAELEESLILCNTGLTHSSGDIHDRQRESMSTTIVRDMVQANVELTYQMRNNLLRGKLFEFGELLDKAWRLKRQFSCDISSPTLDQIYEGALSNGAVGGKLLGAGGGGFFLFYVTPFNKHKLMSYLESMNLKLQQFNFESKGLQAWTIREAKSHAKERI